MIKGDLRLTWVVEGGILDDKKSAQIKRSVHRKCQIGKQNSLEKVLLLMMYY